MFPLVLILIALALLGGFLALTRYERERELRVYAKERARLDALVERTTFVLVHVNLAMFLRDEFRHLVGRMGHAAAHYSLVLVRAVERLLTRLVRRLRTHPEIDPAPRETAREFVRTLSNFKVNLKATHPQISDIS